MTHTEATAATTRLFGKCPFCRTRAVIDLADPAVELNERFNRAKVNGEYVTCPKAHTMMGAKVVGVLEFGKVKGSHNPAVRCDGRCWNAKSADCDCACGGAYHGQGAV